MVVMEGAPKENRAENSKTGGTDLCGMSRGDEEAGGRITA
ncbi:hypothetical protein GALL_431930 [mine drainage metagenome]|uniref:Uncharacterized protein n=1 Tax=mine drainage metagenome TaxID=410659 RepID=A0A1J5Q5H0_9ZZZZ